MAKYQSFENGKFDGKIPLKEVAGMSDKEITGLLQLGTLFYTQGQTESALKILEGLAALDPDNRLVQAALGAVYTKTGDNNAALETLNKANVLDPKDISVYVNRGEVLMRLGRVEDAGKDFKTALDLDPQRKSPAANRARLILVGLAAVAQKMKEKRA